MSELHSLTRPKNVVAPSSSPRGLDSRGGGSTSMPPATALAPFWIEIPGISIPAGRIESGLHTLSIRTDEGDRDMRAYRARIELGESAEAAVLVRFEQREATEVDNAHSPIHSACSAPLPASALLSTALDIQLASHARLKLYVLSVLNGRYFRETFDSAKLGAHASLEWTEANFDAIDGIHSVSIELEGAQSSLNYSGAYAARGRTEHEHILSIRHLGPRTKSRSTLKSALRESAHLIFRGLIRVDPTAPGTDAYLSNRNLIMEDGARAESLPQLQIDTDDVACSHGATTGGPRMEELFYLESRGLDREDAKRVLVQGHLGSIFSALPTTLAEEFEARALDALSPKPERIST